LGIQHAASFYGLAFILKLGPCRCFKLLAPFDVFGDVTQLPLHKLSTIFFTVQICPNGTASLDSKDRVQGVCGIKPLLHLLY
jgi:hypothetical protein